MKIVPKKQSKKLEQSLHNSNNTDEIAELLATACLLDGDDELAAFYFEQAAGLSGLKYYCYLKAAEVYGKLNDQDRAFLFYRCYLDILPEDDEIQVRYAQALVRDNQKRALPILVAHAKDGLAVHNQIAQLFFEFGNYIQTRNWYLSALRCEKNNPKALEGLWKVNFLLKDWEALREIGTILMDLGVKTVNDISIEKLVDNLKQRQKALALLNDLEVISIKLFYRCLSPNIPNNHLLHHYPALIRLQCR